MKDNKQAVKKESFSLSAISKAKEVFSDKPKVKDFVFVIRMTHERLKLFRKFQHKFVYEANNIDFDPTLNKEFFRYIVYKMRDSLKKKKAYKVAKKQFITSIYRKGRRPVGERNVSKTGSSTVTFGPYTDPDVKDTYNNIMYSLYKLEKTEDRYFEYSLIYFFQDVFDFIEKNIDRLIKEENK